MIEFENVSFSYTVESGKVLHNISFKITEGEIVAIAGNNGAGKTTLIKHMNNLLKPAEGVVKIDGEEISKKTTSKLATIVGLAFQNPNHQLFAETVRKELEFGPRNLGYKTEERERIINELADQFQITHLLERSPLELSEGERRLVAIASVLTMNQKMLVLDEPSYGQDYRQKRRLGNYLKELSENGKMVVVVTHDVDFIIDHVPRVIILAEGRIIADGPTMEVLADKEILEQASLVSPIVMSLCYKMRELDKDFPIKISEAEVVGNLKRVIDRKTRDNYGSNMDMK